MINPLTQKPNQITHNANSKIERLESESGVEPFDFEAARHDLTEKWTDEDEKAFEQFMAWRRQQREAAREVRKWQS